MRSIASFVAGRRTKWVVLVLWIVAFVALMPLGSKLADQTEDDTASFLPESAESTRVVELLDEEFDAGETTQGLIVYQREGGLTAADKAKIAADAAETERRLETIGRPILPFGAGAAPGFVSRDGSLAYSIVSFADDLDAKINTAARERLLSTSDDPFTNYVKALERPIYKGLRSASPSDGHSPR